MSDEAQWRKWVTEPKCPTGLGKDQESKRMSVAQDVADICRKLTNS